MSTASGSRVGNIQANPEKFANYEEHLSGNDLELFKSIAKRFGQWLDNKRAYYHDARPIILRIFMAAYRNVLTKLEFSSTSQHPNAPLNLTEHRDNPWVQGYINMASSLAKYAIAFKKDGPDMKNNLLCILQTIGISSLPQDAPTQPPPPPTPPAPTASASAKERIRSAMIAYDLQHFESTRASRALSTTSEDKPTRESIIAMDLQHYQETRGASSSTTRDNSSPGLFHPSATPETTRYGSVDAPHPDPQHVSGSDQSEQPSSPGMENAAVLPPSDLGYEPQQSMSSDMDIDSCHEDGDAEMHAEEKGSTPKPSNDAPTQAPASAIDAPVYDMASRNPLLPDDTKVLSIIEAPWPVSSVVIEVSTQQYASLQRWNARFQNPHGIEHCRILSVCAYQVADIVAHKGEGTHKLDTLWPIEGGLTLTTPHYPSPIALTDSSVRPYALVDLAPFLGEGPNPVSFAQSLQIVNYCLAVVQHTPTPRQLREVEEVFRAQTVKTEAEPEDIVIPDIDPARSIGEKAVENPPSLIKEITLPQADELMLRSTEILFTQQLPTVSPHRQTISLDISQSQFQDLARWNERFRGSDNVETSLIISLSCYKVTDVAHAANGSFTHITPTWPSSGNLSLKHPDHCAISLSPPGLTDEKGFVDLSGYLSLGENQLELSQDKNMMEYIIVIISQAPTRDQLLPVVLRRKKELEWNTFLHDFARPIELPPIQPPWLRPAQPT